MTASRERLWKNLGPSARRRYEALSRACAPIFAGIPHIHLNMIGVLQSKQGSGLGGMLLQRVHTLSRETHGSRGVSLTTETLENVRLYKRFGYEVIAHARVAPELETWGMFRPKDADGDSPRD